MERNAIGQYLQRHAEEEVSLLDLMQQACGRSSYEHCLVIPCYRESSDFVERLRAEHGEINLLVVVVLNQSEAASVPQNQALLRYFAAMTRLWQNQHLHLYQQSRSTIHWLLVDRTGSNRVLPVKQGVGLARKIGCDIGAQLFYQGLLQSAWLHTSDADTHLPGGYFALPGQSYVAAIYPFKHIQASASEPVWRATQLYEQALRYYVNGLRWAGSPYAYQTIGSLMAFTASAYCQVRGFPKRSAGEDFYLINKLSKLGAVFTPAVTLEIEARDSDRVPFGTGPKVRALAAMTDCGGQFCYYSPALFSELKAWLAIIPNIWPRLNSPEEPLLELNECAQSALRDAGIADLWRHLRHNIKTAAACERAIHVWFDAFQTLKFLRRLQASTHPAQPLADCIAQAPFSC